MKKENEILIYQTPDGQTKVEAFFNNENVWLPLDKIAGLFDRDKSTISRHIKNIFDENELDKNAVVADFATTTPHGAMANKTQTHNVAYYSLEMILAIGYRVNSNRGIQFRKWATGVLKEYMQKGFALNDDTLKNLGGGTYWKELLNRIKDIRSSEKVLYRQVLDLYATSMDYNSKQDETIKFFKIVQNKLHYAISGNTAPEIIFNRANRKLPFMGLTVFDGSKPKKQEVSVAKNYLTENELLDLNSMVSAFFDLAEMKARRHEPMYMKDWVTELDKFTANYGRGALRTAGKISHEEAVEKAETEFDAYKELTADELTPVEKEYLLTLKDIQLKLEKKKH